MLLHIPNVLTADELQFCRATVESAAWADGAITAGTQSGQVKNNRQLPEDLPESIRAREVVLAALKRNALFFSAALPKKIYPPRVAIGSRLSVPWRPAAKYSACL